MFPRFAVNFLLICGKTAEARKSFGGAYGKIYGPVVVGAVVGITSLISP